MKVAVVILGILILGGGTLLYMNSSDKPKTNEETGPVKQVVLPVKGMTCEGCAVSVKIALKDLEGVKDTEVDTEKGKATVTYIEGKVTVDQIIEAINKTGFAAQKPSAG